MSRSSSAALTAFSFFLTFAPAFAHVTLETPQAKPGAAYKAVIRVPHGCDGAATIALRAQIPEGLIDVKPMPKPGWTVKTTLGPYQRSYDLFGSQLKAGVREIVWSGGDLPDDFYDEFVFRGSVARELAGVSELILPIIQECAAGANHWVETPKAGADAGALKHPAPRIALAPAERPASTFAAGDINIVRPWARATPGGAEIAGGYLRIENKGDAPDRLVAVNADIASFGELHESRLEDGIMRMLPHPEGLPIPPGGVLELKPGSHHVMFMQLKGPLKAGQSFRGALTFEKAGVVPVTFTVETIGASAPAEDHSGH